MGTQPKKILHVINDLLTGGTEIMLHKLLSRMDRGRFDPAVVSLMAGGDLHEQVEALGIPVHILRMRPATSAPQSVLRFARLARRLRPDLIQGWMYHGNLAAQLAGAMSPRRVPVLWGIRQSLYSTEHEKRTTAAAIKLCARLSNLPAKIVFNSRTSAAQHEAAGYRPEKTCVIPNGFDTELFAPSDEARSSVRAELGLPAGALLIGMLARFHPAKDHANFLNAAALLLRDRPETNFLIAGRGVMPGNAALRGLLSDPGLAARTHLLGERRDVPRLTAALDIATSSSSGMEGFPNVVGEAMSCGVACVVTDISDMAWIVGEAGRVVPPRNPAALARAWKDLIAAGPSARRALGEAARSRVVSRFSLALIASRYESLYESILADQAGGK